MKKLFAIALAGVTMTSLSALACGGMTQINPPSRQLDAGPSNDQMESIGPELGSDIAMGKSSPRPLWNRPLTG